MSKIIMTADVHAGMPNRLEDIDWALRVVTAYCEENSIDTVFDLGDLTHDRVSIGTEVLCKLHDRLKDAKDRGQNWYTFPGNHNMYLKHSWTINSLRPLSGVLNVIETVKIINADGRRFWVLPFVHFERSYMQILSRIEQQYRPDDTLLTHIGVRGSTLNSCFLLKDWSYVQFDDSQFERVYTGHFHIHQQVGRNVHYPGSILPFKFDEGGVQHGFLELDLNTMEHKFVDIMQAGARLLPGTQLPPLFLTVDDQQLDGLDEGDVANNHVRVLTTREFSPGEWDDARERLYKLGARKVYRTDVRAEVEAQKVAIHQAAIPAQELFLRFMNEDVKGTEGLEKTLLTRLEAEIRHEGDELYSSREPDE